MHFSIRTYQARLVDSGHGMWSKSAQRPHGSSFPMGNTSGKRKQDLLRGQILPLNCTGFGAPVVSGQTVPLKGAAGSVVRSPDREYTKEYRPRRILPTTEANLFGASACSPNECQQSLFPSLAYSTFAFLLGMMSNSLLQVSPPIVSKRLLWLSIDGGNFRVLGLLVFGVPPPNKTDRVCSQVSC